uniref:Ran GTPase-activating protein n=1 Tax=Meloidogyne incognita TaxID=6306 RepID=A0A914MT04_MELIC
MSKDDTDDSRDNDNDGMLSFQGQQLKLNTEEDGEKIAEKIRDFPRLVTFEMRGNTLGFNATLPIAEALETHPSLKRALWSDMFTGRLKEEIPKTLKCLCDSVGLSGARLKELDLSDNAIGPMAVPGIKEFLAGESSFELEILKLNNCGLGIAGKTIAQSLIECHKQSVRNETPLQLKVFIAGRNRLEYESTTALAEAFKVIGTLEEISMPQNGIRAEGIIKLAEAIKENPSLKKLNLGDNTFGNSGAIGMAGVLKDLTQLEVLDFSDCLCRDKGSMAIANSLSASKCPLKELNLSGGEITTEAAKNIVKTLHTLTSLKSLKIGVNCFGSEFSSFVNFVEPFGFVDPGTESDDQGTLSEVSDDEEEEDDD